MEEQDKLVFHPMDQFKPGMRSEVSAWEVAPIVVLSVVFAVIPIVAAIWLGRRSTHRSVYLWGVVLVVMLMIALNVIQNLSFELNPLLEIALLETFFAWFPLETPSLGNY